MTKRLQYDKPTYYCNKVLIGPWVQNRANAEYVPQTYKNNTTYFEDYGPKPFSRIDPAIIWDQKLNSEQSNFISPIGRHDHDNFNYFENFSSTYDLSYNHFPKCYKSYIPRILRFRLSRHEPIDDYIPSFGNITKFGIFDYKKEQWACERQDPRRTHCSVYKDTFVAPSRESYQTRRRATPRENSSSLDPNNIQTISLKLRGQPMFNVPPSYSLVPVPQEKRCNPITWECPRDEETKCCKKCN